MRKKAREELAKSTNTIEKRNFWLTKQCHDLETRLSAEVEKRLESNRKLESEKANLYKQKEKKRKEKKIRISVLASKKRSNQKTLL